MVAYTPPETRGGLAWPPSLPPMVARISLLLTANGDLNVPGNRGGRSPAHARAHLRRARGPSALSNLR